MPTLVVRVEVAGRLVGDQEHRPVDEGAGDRDALLLTAGELVGHPVLLAVQADEVEHLGHDLARSVPRGLPITSSAKATFSATVLFGSSRKSWNTVPIWRRSAGTFQLESRARSLPSDVDLAAGSAAPRASTSRRKVDLPEPDAPTRKTNSPFSTSSGDVLERGAGLVRVELGDVVESDHADGLPRAGAGSGTRAGHAGPASVRRPRGRAAVRRPQARACAPPRDQCRCGAARRRRIAPASSTATSSTSRAVMTGPASRLELAGATVAGCSYATGVRGGHARDSGSSGREARCTTRCGCRWPCWSWMP